MMQAQTSAHILIVEDEEDILTLEQYTLEKEGFKVSIAANGEKGLGIALQEDIDLILLDIMLPGMDGYEICQALRCTPSARWLPIIMVTAKSEEANIIKGLRSGADDYVIKPFSPVVLVERVRTVLRRNRQSDTIASKKIIKIHELTLSFDRGTVQVNGIFIPLNLTQFGLLFHLASHPGSLWTNQQLCEEVAVLKIPPPTPDKVPGLIEEIQTRLGDAGRHIKIVKGIGYRFKEDLTKITAANQ